MTIETKKIRDYCQSLKSRGRCEQCVFNEKFYDEFWEWCSIDSVFTGTGLEEDYQKLGRKKHDN